MSDDAMFGMQDGELLSVFLEEAREQLEILDQGLVRLEREPENVELIQGIFRAAHTLKGSSGAMGFRQMADLTHAMEDVLDKVREHVLTVTPELTDALLRGLDLLRAIEQGIEDGGGSLEADTQAGHVATELRALAQGQGSAPASASRGTAPLGKLPDTQIALLVNFSADCQMPGIRAFMVLRSLDAMGTVVETTPTREEIDQGGIGHRLLAVVQFAGEDEEARDAVMRVAEVEWVRVSRGAAAAGMRLDLPARTDRAQVEETPAETPAGRATATAAVPAQQTVRVNVDTLDRIMNLVGELVLDRTRLAQLKEGFGSSVRDVELVHDLESVSNHLGTIVGELHEHVLQARMLPVSQLFNRFPRLVRDVSRSLGKEVDFLIEGESELLDRSVIERLVDPLTHLLRNAVDHGLEMPDAREAIGKPRSGTVRLSAHREEEHVLINISDDGPGIDSERLIEKAIANGAITPERVPMMTPQEVFGLIFASGISTAQQVTDISGRGVGMDVVKKNIEAINGAIMVESEPGLGSTFTLKIPLTLAIIRALLVRVGQVTMALPLSLVEEALKVPRQALQSVRNRPLLQWRDTVVPVIHLGDALPGCGASVPAEEMHLVAAHFAGAVACFAVDAIIGHQEIVVKPLGAFIGEIPGLAGATILGNGRVALIVDVGRLFESGLLQQAVDGYGEDLARLSSIN